ncbi:hypothetical protein [Calothrix sp. PCC 7507]|uniref:hypothetical protein n=1 Tax=Calothrix sp. PCC 7507 TaxID=99598 RepID=UPI000306C612|nr:hypothetical protein [Calothrix sp. PCC 7507]
MPESIKEFMQWIQGFDYRLLENTDGIHPDLSNLLGKCDFQPSITRDGDRLIVVQPKVAIACNLPQALGQGDCRIEFSSIIFRGLKIGLNHHHILSQLMIGLNTKPELKCRPFLKQLDKNAFAVSLGETTVILSAIETTDLCLCIDQVCQEYKNSLVEFENNLETWDLEFFESAGVRGFHLFSVEQKLWDLMYKFASEFDYVKGKSAWHLFHQEDISIRVSRGIRDHAFILPQATNYWSDAQNKINIIYEINDVHLQSLARGKASSWQQDIGPRGTWTAKYTKQWLLEKYIPQVIDYYAQQSQLFEVELMVEVIKYKFAHTPIKDIHDIQDLSPYLCDIQTWLNIHVENIAAVLLRSYYKAFTDLVRNTDSAIAGIDYIMVNLRGVELSDAADKIDSHTKKRKIWTFKNAMSCLDEQVMRINNCESEKSFNADLITRIFIWIIENGKISFSQAQINTAKQALLPLWEQSRFEMRHVYPHR